MAGFFLVFVFGMMVYLLSQINSNLKQIYDVLTICLEFDDLSNRNL